MRRTIEPTDHTYTVTLRIRSPRPYTRIELERLSSWWVYIKDRQLKVDIVEMKAKKGRINE